MTCLASLTIGLSLGLIGAGGSILTIPVFVYLLGIDAVSAGVYSMFVVGLSSLAGGLRSLFQKMVQVRVIALFGIPSIIGVLIARRLVFPMIPEQIPVTATFFILKKTLFLLSVAGLMVFASLRMLKSGLKENVNSADLSDNNVRLMLQGMLTGIITGLLGLGGGFLIVPAIYFWAGLPMKQAIGTTLIIIFFNSAIAFFISQSSITIDWNLLLRFSAGSVLGILAGTKLAEKIPASSLKKIFGLVVLSIALYIFYQQIF